MIIYCRALSTNDVYQLFWFSSIIFGGNTNATSENISAFKYYLLSKINGMNKVE